jgi:hypothetical protein
VVLLAAGSFGRTKEWWSALELGCRKE